MKKIVIAIDSFKGCLTSAEAGEAAAQGVHAACPECRTIVLPVADGGEGMLDVLLAASNGKRITVRAHDPLMQPCDASYGISGDGNTAFVEMAAISGLPLVPADKRNPMKTTTFGTGELIRDALERGCLRFVIGLGGSATNDAGLGMLQALGFRFFDKEGHEVGSMEKGIALCGALLSAISSIDSSSAHPALKKTCFTAACDVRNPFFGPNGAAHVFAPQKGADPQTAEALDRGMRSFAGVIAGQFQTDIVPLSGAGAAGGLGGAFKAFLNARLTAGIEMVLDAIAFDSLLEGADLVITGEERIDAQTAAGKTAAGVLRHAARKGIPVIAIGGSVAMCRELKEMGFIGIYSIINAPVSLEQAMRQDWATARIRCTVEQILTTMKHCAGTLLFQKGGD